MQSFLLLVVAAVSHEAMLTHAGLPDWVTAEMISLAQDDKARCMSEQAVDEAMIQKASDGDLMDVRNLKCYIYCLLESFSLVDSDGNFEPELLIGFLPEDLQSIARDTMNGCASEDGDDPCERVYVQSVCIYKRSPQLWFLI